MDAVLLETWSLRITISPTPPDIGQGCHTMVVEERRKMGEDAYGKPLWTWEATVFHLRDDGDGQVPGLRLVTTVDNQRYGAIVLKHLKHAAHMETALSVLYMVR